MRKAEAKYAITLCKNLANGAVGNVPNLALSVRFEFHNQRKTSPEEDKDATKQKGKTYPRDKKGAHGPATDLDFLERHPVPHDVDLLCRDAVGDVPNLAVAAGYPQSVHRVDEPLGPGEGNPVELPGLLVDPDDLETRNFRFISEQYSGRLGAEMAMRVGSVRRGGSRRTLRVVGESKRSGNGKLVSLASSIRGS